MFNIYSLRAMLGISSQDELVIQRHQNHLAECQQTITENLDQWCSENNVLLKPKASIFIDGYYAALIKGHYHDDFYATQYQQAIHWFKHQLTEGQTLLLLSQIRQQMIKTGTECNDFDLSKAFCHILDLSQGIVSTVYNLNHALKRMMHKAETEIKRIEKAFSIVNANIPEPLVQAYKDHQAWKFNAFSMALGETINPSLAPASTEECRLGQWLESGGWDMIPSGHKQQLHELHQQVHDIGHLIISDKRFQQPENVLEQLVSIEAASDDLADILLEVIDEQLAKVALIDNLTNLANRRAFERDIEKKLAIAQRYQISLGLIFLDIDHFKNINDQRGHAIGDQVLKQMGELLTSLLRGEDIAYRWGGEEFVILLLSDNDTGAKDLAERIRKAVEIETFSPNNPPTLHLTISGGCTMIPPSKSPPIHELIAEADHKLYQAKQNGRNQIVY